MPTLCIVTLIPSPYQVEFFNEFQLLGSWHLLVVYLKEGDVEHPWSKTPLNHEHCFLTRGIGDLRRAWHWCHQADLTVFNYYTNTFALAAMHSRSFTGRPWAFWGERPGFLQLGKIGQFLRRLVMRPLLSDLVPIWGVGKFAIESYREEWGPKKSYFNLPYFSNLTRFMELQHEVHDDFIILYSGLLNRRKDVLTLAQVFLKLYSEIPRARLWVLGSGPLESAMKEALESVSERVRWYGFRSWDELPEIYRQADVLCLPSLHDGWAMVIVEALASGVPVITTTRTGAAIEFVKNGENGWLIPPGDEKLLLQAFREIAALPADQFAEMGEAARNSVRHHTLANGAKQLHEAANHLVMASNLTVTQPESNPTPFANTHIILAGNYDPDGQPSMHRYASLVKKALEDHGVAVTLSKPSIILGRFSVLPNSISKYLGFADKYLMFPLKLRWQAARFAKKKKVLVHLLDQGNALYLPLVQDFNIVATCHDLIAVRAALGEFPEVKPPSTGSWLQKTILKTLGFARTIICDSEKTRSDCQRLLSNPQPKLVTALIPLDPSFESVCRMDEVKSLPDKFLFHIGNSSWYKNRVGVFLIYSELLNIHADSPVLLLMGAPLKIEEKTAIKYLKLEKNVIIIEKPNDEFVRAAYTQASALLFPSIVEGFGWPILEAMACGCPVFTSNRAPMTEVGGDAAIYIDPSNPPEAAAIIAQSLCAGDEWRMTRVSAGLERASCFSFTNFSSSLMMAYELALCDAP